MSAAQRALLAQRLRGTGRLQTVAAIPRVGDTPAPLSAEQEQILAHTYSLAGTPIYNEAVTIVKRGPLDLDALRVAFTALVERHQIWRTTFQLGVDDLVQVVHPTPSFELPLIDLSHLTPEQRETEAAALVAAQAAEPYKLRRGPLLRTTLVRFTEHDHRLYLAMHHIIFDGVSLYRVVLPELVRLYDAAVSNIPAGLPDPVQYGDYALWQRSGVLEAELTSHLAYWRTHLDGAPPLELPLARERPEQQRFRGAMVGFDVPARVVAGLTALAHEAGVTLFTVVVAGYALLLQTLTGQDDLVFATVADLRRRREFEGMVGYCLTPLILRLKLPAGLPLPELLATVRSELLDGLAHAVPLERIVRDLQPERVRGADPLFQAMLVLEPPALSPDADWSLHQLDARIGDALGHTKTDFHIELDQRPEGQLAGRFIYNSDIFDADFGPRTVELWQSLLRTLGDTHDEAALHP